MDKKMNSLTPPSPPSVLEIRRDLTLQLDLRELLASLAETTANFILKGWADAGVSALTSLTKALASLKIGESTPERVWSLTALSFAWSVGQLCDQEGLDEIKVRAALLQAISEAKSLVDENGQYVPLDFLKRPTTLGLYRALRSSLISNRGAFPIDRSINEDTLSAKLDIVFTRAIAEIWVRAPKQYQLIKESLEAPGVAATAFELEWYSYRQSLIYSFEISPVFGQEQTKASLSQLYIPLRAFWFDHDESNGRMVVTSESKIPMSARVLSLDESIDDWVDHGEDDDWLRLIGGGPGSGKSTTLKALACRYASRQDWRPLFVPLQHIGISGDLRDAINRHFADRTDGSFSQPPLSRSAVEDGPPLLLILDGLDELVAPNEAANDAINTFSARINNLVSSLKGDGSRKIRVVVSGRMPAFQAAKRFLAPPKTGCLEVYGYLALNDLEMDHKSDLWRADQREVWWKRFAKATGGKPNTPQALKARELASITHEPLLCYLLVLAGYATNNWKKAAENTNLIYATLMRNIYDRGWGDGLQKRHGPGKAMALGDFLALMETVGLAAWLGGDTRVATESAFNSSLSITGCQRAWQQFQSDNGPDVTNLAMNFYLKAAEGHQRGFEFTHKSFGEYLAAKAILGRAFSIVDLTKRRIEHAMMEWSEATKSGIVTVEILTFLRNEIRLQLANGDVQFKAKVVGLQRAFEQMAEQAIVSGFPFASGTTWRAQEIQQNNAELATWAIINACANALAGVGERESALVHINWSSNLELGQLIMRLNGPYIGSSCITKCMSFIVAKNAYINSISMEGADFRGAVLTHTIFDCGRVYASSFDEAELLHVTFFYSILSDVSMARCNLGGARFIGSALRRIDFDQAVIENVGVDKETVILSDRDTLREVLSGLRLQPRFDERSSRKEIDIEETIKFIGSIPRLHP